MFSEFLSVKPKHVRGCLLPKHHAMVDSNLEKIASNGSLTLQQICEIIEHNYALSWESRKYPCKLAKYANKLDADIQSTLVENLRFMAELSLTRGNVSVIDQDTLKTGNCSLTFSKEEAAIMVASIMIGATPLEHIWFSAPICAQKVNCLMAYFDRIRGWIKDSSTAGTGGRHEKLDQKITILRRQENKKAVIREIAVCHTPLTPLLYYPKGKISDFAHDSIQADFANKYIGGGALEDGNVQEEIMFTVQPELLTSMLFCDPMKSNEAIFITGTETFAKHGGYGGLFHYGTPEQETGPTDSVNRFKRAVTALDASIMYNWRENFEPDRFYRDLIKAYIAFLGDPGLDAESSDGKMPICTGKWGCGMFGGDPELKFLQQWIAASACGRALKFMGFSERSLENAEEVADLALKAGITTSELYIWIVSHLEHKSASLRFSLLEELAEYARGKLKNRE